MDRIKIEKVAFWIFHPGHRKLRKRLKKDIARKRHKKEFITSYVSMLKHCNENKLINKKIVNDNRYMSRLESLGIKIDRPFDGRKVKTDKVVGEKIYMLDFWILPSVKNDRMRLDMQILHHREKLSICGSYQYLIPVPEQVPRTELPLTDDIILQDRGYYFEETINR